MEKDNTKENVTQFEGARSRKKKTLRNSWPLVIIVIAIILAGAYLVRAQIHIRALALQEKEAQKQNMQLQAQKSDLESQLENINSKEYIERIARRDLKLIKPNEILFILPEIGKENNPLSILTGEEELEDQKQLEAERKEQAEAEGVTDDNADKTEVKDDKTDDKQDAVSETGTDENQSADSQEGDDASDASENEEEPAVNPNGIDADGDGEIDDEPEDEKPVSSESDEQEDRELTDAEILAGADGTSSGEADD